MLSAIGCFILTSKVRFGVNLADVATHDTVAGQIVVILHYCNARVSEIYWVSCELSAATSKTAAGAGP